MTGPRLYDAQIRSEFLVGLLWTSFKASMESSGGGFDAGLWLRVLPHACFNLPPR